VKRDRYNTVTARRGFALLIPASANEAMGEATFHGGSDARVLVRSIEFQELRKLVGGMKGAWAEHFSALLALRGALEAVDEVQLHNAKERLANAIHSLERKRLRLSGFPGVSPEFAASNEQKDREWREHPLAFFFLTEPTSGVNEDAFVLFSHEVSRTDGLRRARIVLWWNDGRFVPAIYCDSSIAALYVHTFLIAPTGDIGYRVCPKCGSLFLQSRADQDYCAPAHREAHRVARWRAQQKQESAKAGEQREEEWH